MNIKSVVVAVILASSSGACSTMNLAQVSEFMDRVNAGIMTVDEFAHKFCPSAQVVGVSAKTLACTAKANGTTQKTVNQAIAWGQAFCANPTSTSIASLASNTATGVKAIMAADAAGCSQP